MNFPLFCPLPRLLPASSVNCKNRPSRDKPLLCYWNGHWLNKTHKVVVSAGAIADQMLCFPLILPFLADFDHLNGNHCVCLWPDPDTLYDCQGRLCVSRIRPAYDVAVSVPRMCSTSLLMTKNNPPLRIGSWLIDTSGRHGFWCTENITAHL